MARRAAHYWLMKSEPDDYSVQDLRRDGSASWDGVRNYQARNFMRNEMAVGDWVLFYHSNAKPPGVAGLARVSKDAYPDHTAFDPKGKYYDEKSSPDEPRWFMVDVKFVEEFAEVVSLETLKNDPDLEEMRVTRRGQRLSVQPVDKEHFLHVVKLGGGKKGWQ